MDKTQLLNLLQDNNGVLISKRCTEQYLQKHHLTDSLDQLIPPDFGTVSERIKHLKYGGGFCETCGVRTAVSRTGDGFAKFCPRHKHDGKRGKVAHNRKDLDVDIICQLYVDQLKSVAEISRIVGGVSNVTIMKALRSAGVVIRTHSENQKLHAKRGFVQPRIKIDRAELVVSYRDQKIPIKQLAESYGCDVETIRRFLIQEGVERSNRRSYIEQKIRTILIDLQVDFIANTRSVIPPLELDFFLPEYNIAIEVNGLYTHSVYSGGKDKNYHKRKYRECCDKGIKLFQFWEHQINETPEIVASMIGNACRKNPYKISARKCIVAEVGWRQLRDFCKDNHIQGAPGKNSKGIGLFEGDRLVSVIGYVVKGQTTIITRFCSLRSHNIVGGFQKLLSKLPRPIITYSANDISDGHLYSSSGFSMIRESDSMFYTDYSVGYPRNKFMKIRQPTLLADFQRERTEVENMIANGYDLCFSAGIKTWLLS